MLYCVLLLFVFEFLSISKIEGDYKHAFDRGIVACSCWESKKMTEKCIMFEIPNITEIEPQYCNVKEDLCVVSFRNSSPPLSTEENFLFISQNGKNLISHSFDVKVENSITRLELHLPALLATFKTIKNVFDLELILLRDSDGKFLHSEPYAIHIVDTDCLTCENHICWCKDNTCSIDGECYRKGEKNKNNHSLSCQPLVAQDMWTSFDHPFLVKPQPVFLPVYIFKIIGLLLLVFFIIIYCIIKDKNKKRLRNQMNEKLKEEYDKMLNSSLDISSLNISSLNMKYAKKSSVFINDSPSNSESIIKQEINRRILSSSIRNRDMAMLKSEIPLINLPKILVPSNAPFREKPVNSFLGEPSGSNFNNK